MKTILVAAALAAETMTSCTSFALQRPRVTRQLLRFASSSTTSAEEWKRKRPLRIRARYIPPGDDTTGRDGIVVHFQRHGQGTHNQRWKDWVDEKGEHPDLTSPDPSKNPLLCETMIDAPLTQKGINQCMEQQSAASKLQNVELIVMSPLQRAIQTAQITFDAFRTREDVKWTLHEDLREELGLLMCNKRRSLSEIQQDFPLIDCSYIQHEDDFVWAEHCAKNMNKDGEPMRENDFDMSSRAYKFLENFIATRNEKEIAVVGHSALFLSMTTSVLDVSDDEVDLIKPMFGQAELRSMELTFEEH